MGRAKDILIKAIPAKVANAFVKKHHYSGKVVVNSQLHFGAFLDEKLHGVLSFGPSMCKDKIAHLINGTKWNEFVELNRMAFDESLPRNSESRCIAIAMKLIKKHCPHIKWVVTFADATQCGDGTIYRASGFLLTGYSHSSMWLLPPELAKINNGEVAHRLKVQDKCSVLSKYIMNKTNGKNLTMERYAKLYGGSILPGYMFRYILLLDKSCKLNTNVYDYSIIKELKAEMYKGQKITRTSYNSSTAVDHTESGVQVDSSALLNAKSEVIHA